MNLTTKHNNEDDQNAKIIRKRSRLLPSTTKTSMRAPGSCSDAEECPIQSSYTASLGNLGICMPCSVLNFLKVTLINPGSTRVLLLFK